MTLSPIELRQKILQVLSDVSAVPALKLTAAAAISNCNPQTMPMPCSLARVKRCCRSR